MFAPLEEHFVVVNPHKDLLWLTSGHGATPAELAAALVDKVLVQSPPVP